MTIRWGSLICICVLVTANSAMAQHTVGRWAFGLQAQSNLWLNDMNKQAVGFGGELTVRYGLTRHFSISAEFGVEALKASQRPTTLDAPHSYLKLNSTPAMLLSYVHILPGNAFAPYVFAGIGYMRYTRIDGVGIYRPSPAENGTIRIPVGAGIEIFTSGSVAFNMNASYAILNDATDLLTRGRRDAMVTARAGVTLYLGVSDDDDDDGDGLTTAEERRLDTNPTNPDTDEDGLTDGAEATRLKTDPLNADSDGDFLKDGAEIYQYFTDPLNPDSDGDGVTDFDEVRQGSDPHDPASLPPK